MRGGDRVPLGYLEPVTENTGHHDVIDQDGGDLSGEQVSFLTIECEPLGRHPSGESRWHQYPQVSSVTVPTIPRTVPPEARSRDSAPPQVQEGTLIEGVV